MADCRDCFHASELYVAPLTLPTFALCADIACAPSVEAVLSGRFDCWIVVIESMWVPVTVMRTCMLPLHSPQVGLLAVLAATAVPVIVRLCGGAVVVVVVFGGVVPVVEGW